uniref:Uncharacterized protein n=1 Tax=Anguilla anguilla TaxID=7936 RepID=A0A0E9QHW0_ANGAN
MPIQPAQLAYQIVDRNKMFLVSVFMLSYLRHVHNGTKIKLATPLAPRHVCAYIVTKIGPLVF